MALSDEEKIVDFVWGGGSSGSFFKFYLFIFLFILTEDSMNSNFIAAATEKFIKVWDIEFGSLKYKHQLKYKYVF